MKNLVSFFRHVFSIALMLFSVQISALELRDPATALQTYVEHDDGMYNIRHLASVPGSGFTAHVYSLTSQQWLTAAEISQPVWTHHLVVIVPAVVRSNTAMLFVSGDDNDDPLPGPTNETVQVATQLALGSQSIVAALFQIPNQPLTYVNGPSGKEDVLVSWSWKKALDTGNYEWVMYLPMTKAVVKAMDAVQQLAPALGQSVDNFVLTGFSKRGEAVWLAAAVDDRVRAVAPGVIDLLNFADSFEHHYKSYGSFSPVVDSYVQLGILQKIRSPEFRDLEKLIDPYQYRDRYTMPKFILNASGDEFFLPDSSRFYFDQLPGEKHIRFAPNTGHGLSNSATGVADTLYSLLGWYQSILYNLPRPELHWEVQNGVLTASTSIPPAAVRVWRAHNPAARDFRRYLVGEIWIPTLLSANTDGRYAVTLDTPAQGFSAAYIEFVYNGPAGLPLSYSTQVYVTPDVYPHELGTPVMDPKPAYFWHRQIKDALAGRTGNISAETLNSYLPIPLFDYVVNTLEVASDNMQLQHGDFLDDLAERECLATRFNISNSQFGWYSTVDLGWGLGNKLLWQHYQTAHDAEADGFPWLSALICAKLNAL